MDYWSCLSQREQSPLWRVVFYLAVVLLTSTCSQERNITDKDKDVDTMTVGPSEYLERGDLQALKSRGELRVLLPINQVEGLYLPRSSSSLFDQHAAIEEIAAALGLKIRIVPVRKTKDLIPALLEGRGDLIGANIKIKAHHEGIAFTAPLAQARAQIITRADDISLRKTEDLEGRSIFVDPESPFWDSVMALKESHPGIDIQAIPELEPDEILDKVAKGELDLSVQDSNTMDMVNHYRDDLRAAMDISEERPIAWCVRADALQLQNALNRFLHNEKLTERKLRVSLSDLPEIKKRKVIRVLLRNNAASYFLWRGELLGFEYELVKRFAKKQDLRLEVVVPPSHELLITWLAEGKGDIAAGFLAATEDRKSLGIDFSTPYHYAAELVVARSTDESVKSPQDMAGRTLVVRRSSSYWQTLEKIRAQGINFRLLAAPEYMETEEIISKVAFGEYDLTVADGHILDIELSWRDDIRTAFALGESIPHSWGVRSQNKELLKAVNDFLKKEYRGLFYNVTYEKYFKNQTKIQDHLRHRVDGKAGAALSPYDELVRKYADSYGFDWRLIVAQMYQESRFNPKARSWSGARGLMQIMPRTAKHMGIKNLKEPEQGIHAGIKYLDWLRERFESDLPVTDRMWFALAAYNAGAGHVHDARQLARKMGWDANRWFNNVEKAMLLLSKREYARNARFGYVRGREPVNYVRSIHNRFRAYVKLTKPAQAKLRRRNKEPVSQSPTTKPSQAANA